MTNQPENKKELKQSAALLMPTKEGKGYKIVINSKWFYTSTQELIDMIANKTKACAFRTLEEIKTANKQNAQIAQEHRTQPTTPPTNAPNNVIATWNPTTAQPEVN